KVIGSRDAVAQLGETDLRGVFVADPVDGRLTVVARSGAARYAIHRSPADDDRADGPHAARGRGKAAASDSGSGEDLRALGREGRERQIRRLQQRGAGGMMGGMGGMMGGGVR